MVRLRQTSASRLLYGVCDVTRLTVAAVGFFAALCLFLTANAVDRRLDALERTDTRIVVQLEQSVAHDIDSVEVLEVLTAGLRMTKEQLDLLIEECTFENRCVVKEEP